jgi:hypothetical protein
MLVEEEVEANNEVANILLELGDVNKPMLLDKEVDMEVQEQQQQDPYQDNEPYNNTSSITLLPYL